MSTLLEYLALSKFSDARPKNWKASLLAEQPFGFDEFANFVSLNAYNEGANLTAPSLINSGIPCVANFNGFYTDDVWPFDFGAEDFTVRIQFGFGSYYAYNDLEGEQLIPALVLGESKATAPFAIVMLNPGYPTNVQQGDIGFVLNDSNGNQAYCFLSSNDWYLPTYGAVSHFEFSRRGQVFTLNYVGLYGLKTVSNTFPSFGSVDVSGISRVYLMSGPTFGSIHNTFRGLQVTKGMSRTAGNACFGAYNSAARYPVALPVNEVKSSAFVLQNLNRPIAGIVSEKISKGAVEVHPSLVGLIDVEKLGFGDISCEVSFYGEGTLPVTDEYWDDVAVVFNANDYSSATLDEDAKGNSISWHINENYSWIAVDPADIVTLLSNSAINFRSPLASTYAGYIRRATFDTPTTIDLSGDFTFEAFIYCTGSVNDTNRLIATFNENAILRSNGAFRVFYDQGGINYYLGSGLSEYMNKITYIAVTRESGTMKLYLDGVEKASMTFTSNMSGQLQLGTDNWDMAIDDKVFSMRVTPGIVRTITALSDVDFPLE